ncbi:MAG: hypothetical protein EA341_00055 [Mongoliibacter sp.]|uniref:hypothetical protein n=1 Tax=Mongoliibacter sp. TaxID=2022438 RepID=UPI0012F290CF|nr:hypothetical protein [Mongoliibacter sp.]TVP54691.1 MAG: hypothetical protein EA341_00055 [Mongoliibacter sp.]
MAVKKRKGIPQETLLLIKSASVFILIFGIIPLTSFLIWFFMPSAVLNVVVLDKTVPNESAQEHQAIHWSLNHLKYLKEDGKPYDVSTDYFGYFPGYSADEGKVVDFNQLSQSDKSMLLDKSSMVYYADTYGVYENDFIDDPDDYRSEKIYGGMDQADVDFLEEALKREKYVIAEFNTMASPTPIDIRNQVEELVGIKWTGWITRYFDELDTLINDELPRWMIEAYIDQHEGQWDFKGSGQVFLHERGRLEILESGVDISKDVPSIMSDVNNQRRFGIPEIVKYPYWIDVVLVSRDYDVISYFEISPTESGINKLRDMGLPRFFPAAVSKKVGENGRFFYFSGDFADMRLNNTSHRFYALARLYRLFLHAEDYSQPSSFFWNYYYPLFKTILADASKNVEVIKPD